MVDESFADFSDEPDNSLIEQKFIETYRRLYVMKVYLNHTVYRD